LNFTKELANIITGYFLPFLCIGAVVLAIVTALRFFYYNFIFYLLLLSKREFLLGFFESVSAFQESEYLLHSLLYPLLHSFLLSLLFPSLRRARSHRPTSNYLVEFFLRRRHYSLLFQCFIIHYKQAP